MLFFDISIFVSKYVIENDSEFGFLKNLVADVPGIKSLPQNRKSSCASRSGASLETSESSDDEQSAEDSASPVDCGPSKCAPRKRQRVQRRRPVPSEDHLTDVSLAPFENCKSRSSTKRSTRGMKSHLKNVNSSTTTPTKLSYSTPFPPHADNHGNSYVDCHPSPV